MHPMLNIAVRAARRAGGIIARSVEHVDGLTITSKAKNDFVSEVDRLAEREIIEIIRKAYPNHGILAEESGHHKGDDYQWVIDPLDGTTNFIHGFPQFAVSIALLHKGRLDQAVIYDPMSQDLYTASRGSGAQLNGRRIRVTDRKNLDGALIGTGFPFRQREKLDTYMETFKAMYTDTGIADIRRAGSAALDLAYVAAGRLDGFWEFGLNQWDIAAGALLIKEAGGQVGDFNGDDGYLTSGNIIAGNLKLFDHIVRTLRPHLPEGMRR